MTGDRWTDGSAETPGVETDREARDLLETLVATPSESGAEEACAERLRAFFAARGREAWLDDTGNVRAPADDSVLLTSHVDTVPGEVPVRVETTPSGPVLWGRGSVDAKGSLVAMAVAAVRTGVSFAGVVGEEADSRGARHLVAERDPPGAVVNGEPSGWDALTLGYRGLVAGTYGTTSEMRHSSRPANNAIEDALDWWDRVSERVSGVETEVRGEGDGRGEDDRCDGESESRDRNGNGSRDESVFERVTAKPVRVEGGPTDDGHSVAATVDVQFRVPPSKTVEAIRAQVTAATNSGTVEWTDAVPPTVQSHRTELARAVRAGIRSLDGDPRMLRKTGTSDVNLYADAWDCPMVTYGPGDSTLDHAPDERLPLCDLDRAVAVLESVCADRT